MTPTDKLRTEIYLAVRSTSQHRIAREAGVSGSVVSRFLKGANIRSDVFDALSAWLERETSGGSNGGQETR